ncbi:TonB-dependent siderophore receptor [Acetobacter syzygii]|uniref:TonB-dependent siderophore receptor n=1 Tax=Acetobacter syzygii TaxID=146476 RepID=A0A270BLV2_9PROT|nr:TonB-dependent siderophore receptor [Acetobacter syzygii]PAL26008.1 TonB-dependent siderophore receptor [Acetobacter syzygii]PAL26128.1 TonB-dependent siderophore receptor [Acetobacter syzygii]
MARTGWTVSHSKAFWARRALFLASSTMLGGAVIGTVSATAAPVVSIATKSFLISPQPLANALTTFGMQSGWQISVPDTLTAKLSSPGVSGSFAPDVALSHLLAGTGLTYQVSGSHSVIIKKASANITLGPVRVGGTVAHQDPTGPGVGYFAENTMAGTKTDTPIIEIPNSIYVVTKQQMVDQQAQKLTEALRYSPGIYAEPQGTELTGAASGSGIRQRGFITSQYVDGIMSNSYTAGETAFLDRIEVVNGPASVMYGQVNPGGMIGTSLKKPTATPLHDVSVGFGNWGRYEATFDISDKITKTGNLRYRVAAIGVTQGAQTEYVHYKRLGVLPSLTWDIDPKTSLTLVGGYIYTPFSGTTATEYPLIGTLIPGPEGRVSRRTFYGDPKFNHNSAQDAMFEYQFRHEFNKYITFNQSFRYERSQDHDQYMPFWGRVSPTEFVRVPWDSNGINRTIGLDTKLTGHIATGPVSQIWVVGSDFRQIKSYSNYSMGDNDVINIYHPVYDLDMTCIKNPWSCNVEKYPSWTNYFQEGVYFQDQIKWKGLSILLGGRQDWFNSHTVGATRDYNTDGSTTTIIDSHSHMAQSAFTWRAGLVYKLSFGLAPYFSYATSFIPQTTRNWRGNPFSPLTGKQYEAGLKYQVPGSSILLTAAAFHINENHFLITDPDHPNYSADAGRVASKGVELSANANITKDLRLTASYTYDSVRYAKSNLTQAVIDAATGETGDKVSERGKYVQSVPRNMMSAFFDYTVPQSFVKGFGINWGIRYTGFTYADAANSFKVPAYVLFDVGAHYDFGQVFPALKGLRSQIAISNLTNRYYITSCGRNDCYLGQGRRVYGNLSYSW